MACPVVTFLVIAPAGGTDPVSEAPVVAEAEAWAGEVPAISLQVPVGSGVAFSWSDAVVADRLLGVVNLALRAARAWGI